MKLSIASRAGDAGRSGSLDSILARGSSGGAVFFDHIRNPAPAADRVRSVSTAPRTKDLGTGPTVAMRNILSQMVADARVVQGARGPAYSQASPTPLALASAWVGLATSGQLSSQAAVTPPVHGWSPSMPLASPSSAMPSLSSSGSQALPRASESVSVWLVLATAGQLSQTSPCASPSKSAWIGLL